ncbi:uncharacterized protein yc1106_01549 [Curvularia clavata]|uniref:Uncharacterized protein n=1 Tax=Curvularia clavata TaxID=95742 RepID=A0A9Q9DPM5_CURCL|nr:uncharacterized protein yc1106_01549 [Curvularia clavata]
MPRRLPWASTGATSRAKVNPTSLSSVAASRVNIDGDEFFAGTTISASGHRGRGEASDSDSSLPNIPAEPPTPHAKLRKKDAFTERREESSSPPPLTEYLEQPRAERMRKSVSKFDLRDDEWMMVEDEFLETAKLFTRHLHIAEYERLKEIIEEKKKGAVSRPVVANAKMSTVGTMKSKAESQEQQQKKAIRDVFASQDDEREKTRTMSSTHVTYNKSTPLSSITKRALADSPKPRPRAAPGSDSEDLDTLRRPIKPRLEAITTPSPKINNPAGGLNGVSSPTPITKISSPTFIKPAPPQAVTKARSRISRATPFEMLDDWVPKKSQYPASPEQPIKSPATPRTPATTKPSRSFDPFDNAKHSVHVRSTSFSSGTKVQQKGSEAGGRSEDLEARLAKRRADREKNDRDKKRKTLNADDIPTFLF